MNKIKKLIYELHSFIILWLTQSFSTLGSSMTNFALIIWSYQQQGSALKTSMLSICSYAPYVIISIFAGALSDKWNKKATMLVCDSFAAVCTVSVLILLLFGKLQIWHLYCLNALNGLMNSIQQPSADVTISLLTPKKHYQKASGMRAFSNSLVNVMTPVISTALLALSNIQTIIAFDLFTFVIAFLSLLFFVKIPKVISTENAKAESVLESAKSGIRYLRHNRGILDLILFLAAINFTASVFEAALPAMVLSKSSGSESALGIVNAVSGLAMVGGSILVSLIPSPKSRVRIICNSLLLAMSTENFFLAFGKSVPVWCIGAFLGWIAIPFMNANMDVLFRNHIPLNMQGRVYSARNTLQFFTIPIGYFLGGFLVDKVFEPFMASQSAASIFVTLFGQGKGAGAAFLFLWLGFIGLITCLIFRKDPHILRLEK